MDPMQKQVLKVSKLQVVDDKAGLAFRGVELHDPSSFHYSMLLRVF